MLLHELTHRAQFTGVPWMREHFTGLVNTSVRLANPDPRRIAEAIREAFSDRDRARQQVRDSGVFGLIATPEQRERDPADRRADVAARRARRRDHEPSRRRPRPLGAHGSPRCCRPGADDPTRSAG